MYVDSYDFNDGYESHLYCQNEKCGQELSLSTERLLSDRQTMECPYCKTRMTVNVEVQFRVSDVEVWVEDEEEENDD